MFDKIIQVTEDFHNKFRIGIGGEGSVYKVQLESIGNVAVKKLHALPDGRGYDKESLKELQALGGTGHRNIVKLYGYCKHRRVSFFIYEYFEKGSLANVLRNEDTARGLNWSGRFKVIKGVAAALPYMHHDCKKQFIYHDINSKNILLDDEYEPHIPDFGLARLVDFNTPYETRCAGIPGYIPPGNIVLIFLK